MSLVWREREREKEKKKYDRARRVHDRVRRLCISDLSLVKRIYNCRVDNSAIKIYLHTSYGFIYRHTANETRQRLGETSNFLIIVFKYPR